MKISTHYVDRLTGGISLPPLQFSATVIFTLLLLLSPVRAADSPAAAPVESSSTSVPPLPFPTLTSTDLHKFILGNGAWIYGTLVSVGQSTVNMKIWEVDKHASWKEIRDSSGKGTGIAIAAFSKNDQAYIKNWLAKHPDGLTAATNPPPPPSPTGIAMGRFCLIDTSGVLKGKTVTAIASGAGHYLALCSDGTLAAWGINQLGQLGNGKDGDDALSLVPVLVDISALRGKQIVTIVADFNSNYVLCADGSLYVWGGEGPNHLGGEEPTAAHNYFTPHNTPTLFNAGALQGRKIVAFATGGEHCVALCADGALVSWGINDGGQVGDGSTPGNTYKPIKIIYKAPTVINQTGLLQGKTITAISAGLALCADGTLAVWGELPAHRRTHPPYVVDAEHYAFAPVHIVDETGALQGKTIVAVTEAGPAILALCSDGTLAAWGGTTEKTKPGSVPATPYPVVLNDTGVLKGKNITSIIKSRGSGEILCADGTKAEWNGNGPPVSLDSGPFAGRTILAAVPAAWSQVPGTPLAHGLAAEMVLFKEPMGTNTLSHSP